MVVVVLAFVLAWGWWWVEIVFGRLAMLGFAKEVCLGDLQLLALCLDLKQRMHFGGSLQLATLPSDAKEVTSDPVNPGHLDPIPSNDASRRQQRHLVV